MAWKRRGAPPGELEMRSIDIRPGEPARRRLRALAAPLLALLAACGGKPAAGPGGPAGGAGAHAVPVRVQTVAATDIADSSEYLATLRSRRSVNVQPQVEGVVTRIFVKSGDRVAAGAPLLQIDPAKQRAAVASQEATRQLKRSALDYARQQTRRMEVLYKGGAVSKQALEQADSTLAQAQADYDALGAQVEEQKVELRYYRVTAPEAGIVGDIPVRVGDRVTTATLLTTLDANQALEVYIAVPLERAGDLKLGLPVEIVGDGGRVLARSAIDFVAPQVDDQTQSVLVKAPVSNDLGLRAAQFVRGAGGLERASRGGHPGARGDAGLRPVLRLRRRAGGAGGLGSTGIKGVRLRRPPAAAAARPGGGQRLRRALRPAARRAGGRLRGAEAGRRRPDRPHDLEPELNEPPCSPTSSSQRPVFATVCALLIVLAGAVCIPTLPIAQYPTLAPPQVNVTSFYTGASSQVVETAVTTPLEQQINGVEGMRYITSTSANDGSSSIVATFDIDRDIDLAAVDVQNRVSAALGRLPNEVKTTGVTVTKSSTRVRPRRRRLLGARRVRPALHLELRRRLRQGRPEAGQRGRRRPHLRRAQVLDAHLARPGAPRQPRG